MNREKYPWIYDLLFLLVFLLAGYLRLTGVNWGEGGGQHPDENHFSGVLGSLRAQKCSDPAIAVETCPPDQKRWIGLGDYFNSATSPLNPYNRGAGSYVYGNLPMTIIRIAADATDQTDLRSFGRQFSAFADLFAILVLYLIVSRLYSRRVGLLAALFSGLTVMQIQQSHFFTVDLFVNAFAFLALWFAVLILEYKESDAGTPAPAYDASGGDQRLETRDLAAEPAEALQASTSSQRAPNLPSLVTHPLVLLSIGFGFALGMAMASKINIAPLAIVLPVAFVLRYLIQTRQSHQSFSDHWKLNAGYWTIVIVCLIAGGLGTLISFRIFQPYTFDGFGLDPRWVADIAQQRAQARGDADLPWNLQWARRSHLFSFVNLTVWGLGLPLGILAWAGFLYMGWRILKGEWRHALLWGWTAFYFLWQSLQFNPTMRYQLPIYPLLAMMAAWFVFELAGRGAQAFKQPGPADAAVSRVSNVRRMVAGLVGVTVLLLTAIWAFAFHSIYLRDEPRVAASRWIFQNIPGPINLQIATNDNGTYNQPLPFPTGASLEPTMPYQASFVTQSDGVLKEILLAHVAASPKQASKQLYLTVWQNLNDPEPLASAFTMLPPPDTTMPLPQVASFEQAPAVTAYQTYYLQLELAAPEGRMNVCGAIHISIQTADQAVEQVIDVLEPCVVAVDQPYLVSFIPQVDGTLAEVKVAHIAELDAGTPAEPQTLSLFLSREPGAGPEQSIARAAVTETFAASGDPRGQSYTLALDPPVEVEKGDQYYLQLQVDSGMLFLSGATVANETDYDYPLPLRIDSYDAFGGIYRGDLNLQVYWDDNAEKLNRFVTMLNDTDYILIPTNHQYGQITRLPERYPLTTLYYRELIGCPDDKEIIWCYRVGQPGMFEGRLGYDLVAVFETYPKLGPIVVNDQAAEEAFTFYDHPKVMIFEKKKDFAITKVQSILGSVDLAKVIHLAPRQFDDYSTLLLPADRLSQQRAGGTWSELFDYDWIQNRYPALGLAIWYLFVFLLGLAVYPLTRLAMPGLADKGYPLSRALGLVLFGYLAWAGGSVGIPYTRLTTALIFGLILLGGGLLAYYQRDELREEWRSSRKYFLMIEGLFLAFFVMDLIIRIGNPDLWHPAKGGERPMDFSYFNAVLKSTVFPPYDPWFAGGYINYYYYGFVLVGTPVKLLGIVPSIAYNLILPTLFAMVGLCAFSIGWNLVQRRRANVEDDGSSALDLGLVAGLAAAALTLLLGNLGTIQLIYHKLQELGAQGSFSWEPTLSIFQRWAWALQGFLMTLRGASLPMGPGDWYWNPSRVLPPLGGNEITEFPLFTFIYSDLHAHMIAIPLALLAVSWALAVVLGRAQWRNPLAAALGLAVGGLIIGVFYPANLSDTYTYLLIGMIAIGYAVFRHAESFGLFRRLALALGAVILLFLLSHYLYEPYRAWYSQAYSALDPWKGPFTPVWSYLTHWLVFLFIVVSWMVWETHEWMASTPVSALRKLKPYALLIEGALVVFVLALLVLQYLGTSVGWIALPIAVWAGLLLLRPHLPDAKRFVLFLIGTALLITIVVEVVVVSGDIGRQNTIFKFYMQAWLLLAVSAAAAFTWALTAFVRWLPGWRAFWQTAIVFLITGAALFTITGTGGKIRDRWIVDAPRTLDAMTFMNYAQYDDFGQRLDLSEDYRAIRWMQDHVQGSPVIVEGNCSEYRWCTRFTIYTGLPGVVGWNWHQRQQRVLTSTWVESRVAEVGNFYTTTDISSARNFLARYDVKYIVVGQLERAQYNQPNLPMPDGLAKFEEFEGKYWQEVYREGNTAIYEVID
jgi:YYY domain-containing protein